jgi:hypothetical protein
MSHTARRAWGPWPCPVVSGSKCHCFSSPWYAVKPIWYWKIPEWGDWMPRPIPGRGGTPAEQTGSEVLPVHIYHNEEKWRCGLFPSLVLFSLVTPPSSARSGGTIFDVACVALQPFAARGSQLYLVVWVVIGGSWYPWYKTPIRRQFNFSSISRKWTIMGHMSLLVIFFVIFCILLDAHVVQSRINFDNIIEIHLTYLKQ